MNAAKTAVGRPILLLIPALLAIGGCTSHRAASASGEGHGPATAMAATRPNDPKAKLTLDQIQPRAVLPAPKPTTRADEPPSLDAIELYARARDQLIQNQRYSGIGSIERALAIDPDSFELNYALGRAYLGLGSANDQAIAAFETASAIKPDDLEVQVELGRTYQARGDIPKAIARFRLAMQTREYHDGDPLAGVVDYRLALALEQQGYDRAALECYNSLLYRVEHGGSGSRTSPEVSYLMMRPELLYDEIGKLYEKQGDLVQALLAYEHVAEASPSDFDMQARVVRMLARLHRNRDAMAAAADVVRRFHASVESINLLREIHQISGNRGSFADILRTLYRENPRDRAILFALADTLASSGQLDQARQLLEQGIEQHNGDVEITQRLFSLYADRDQVADAARLIIVVTAAHPDTTSELEPSFLDLMRLSRKNSLRLPGLMKIEVPPAAEAAKQYWAWRVATQWTRPSAARNALEQSSGVTPPFDPACRAQLDAIFNRADLDTQGKQKASTAFIDSVKDRGRPDLAAELRGLLALRANMAQEAVAALGEAVKLSPPRQPSPDLQLEYALALLAQENAPRFEQLMWKLLADRPRFNAAYEYLYRYFKDRGAESQAWNVLNTWIGADPNNVAARIQVAVELYRSQRRTDESLALVRKLFEQRPDDMNVVASLKLLFEAAGQTQQAIDLLEAERAKHPGNRIAVEVLVDIYSEQKRLSDATRIVDAARAAVADDADLLYYVAHLYQQIDQQQTSEQVLEQVLKLDPTHAQAGNDLGYTWADEGKNLDRAEALIRLAVNAEPDNPSYLDSLGWVLYKRGHFDEALKLLEQASQPAESADPVVLNHLGDVLYRLTRSDDARHAWRQSLTGIEGQRAPRQDLVNLRLELQNKLRASEAGQPVNVAPVVESPPSKEQAKN